MPQLTDKLDRAFKNFKKSPSRFWELLYSEETFKKLKNAAESMGAVDPENVVSDVLVKFFEDVTTGQSKFRIVPGRPSVLPYLEKAVKNAAADTKNPIGPPGRDPGKAVENGVLRDRQTNPAAEEDELIRVRKLTLQLLPSGSLETRRERVHETLLQYYDLDSTFTKWRKNRGTPTLSQIAAHQGRKHKADISHDLKEGNVLLDKKGEPENLVELLLCRSCRAADVKYLDYSRWLPLRTWSDLRVAGEKGRLSAAKLLAAVAICDQGRESVHANRLLELAEQEIVDLALTAQILRARLLEHDPKPNKVQMQETLKRLKAGRTNNEDLNAFREHHCGVLLRLLHRPSEARGYFDNMLRSKKCSTDLKASALHQVGAILQEEKQFEEASSVFKRCVKLWQSVKRDATHERNHRMAYSLIRLYQCYERLGHPKRAKATKEFSVKVANDTVSELHHPSEFSSD